RDDNETGLHDNEPHFAETFMDYNTSGSYDPADTYFRGLGCTAAAEAAGHCQQLANVRRSSIVILSTDGIRSYVFSPNANFAGSDWVSSGGGAPQAWGDAVLSGVTDASSGGYIVEPRGGNIELDELDVTLGKIYTIRVL